MSTIKVMGIRKTGTGTGAKETVKKTGGLLSRVGTEANTSSASSNKKMGRREVITLSSGKNVIAKRTSKKGAENPTYKIGRKTYADNTGEYTVGRGKDGIGRNKNVKNVSPKTDTKTVGQKLKSVLPKVGGPKPVYLKGGGGFKAQGTIRRNLK